MIEPRSRPAGLATLYDQPWLLLSLTALFWAGNSVVGRLAVDVISPMTLTLLRWLGAAILLAALIPRQLWHDAPLARRHAPYLLAMGAFGFTAFNALLYIGAQHTNGVNLLVIQGAIPIMIMAGAALLFGQTVTLLQLAGFALTLLGVAVTATHGEIGRLVDFRFNSGDLMVLAAGLIYAVYALALRRKPPLAPLSLFFCFVIGATIAAVLGLAIEIAAGAAYWPRPLGWLLVAYCIIFPSIASQLFFMRGVELIGAGRAGLCVNLIPVFGAFLMVGIGEPFLWSHAVALALVLGGVAIAESGRPPAVTQNSQAAHIRDDRTNSTARP